MKNYVIVRSKIAGYYDVGR